MFHYNQGVNQEQRKTQNSRNRESNRAKYKGKKSQNDNCVRGLENERTVQIETRMEGSGKNVF